MPRASLLLLLGLAATTRAASLDGFIVSREGREPVAFARVSLLQGDAPRDTTVAGDTTALRDAAGPRDAPSARDTTAVSTLSDARGHYVLNDVAPGRYVLLARATGFREQREAVVVPAGPTRHDVTLEAAPFPLGTIDVKGQRDPPREEAALPSEVAMTARQLATLPGVGEQDIVRSLQLLPGVQAASDMSSGLYIRGGGPDQTLVLLDQVPLYNPTHAFGFFSTFNPGAVQEVTLFKGAYPAPYGGRLGSVLDVTNREGNRSAFHGQGSLSLIAGRMTVEGPVRGGSWILSARRTYLDPVLDAVRSESNEVPSYYFYDVNARLSRRWGADDEVAISGYRGRDVLHLDLDVGSFVDIRWGNRAGTAQWGHRFGPDLNGSVLVAASEYRSNAAISLFETPIRFSNSVLDASAKADLDWRPGRFHRVHAGWLVSAYRFQFDQVFNEVEQAGLDESPTSIAAYLEDEWALAPGTLLRPGVRIERFAADAPVLVEPRLALTQSLGSRVRAKLGGGAYAQHLQLVSTEGLSGADFWVPTDASAEAGRSWQAVGGLEWEPTPARKISVEGYYTSLRHLVQLDDVRPPDAGGSSADDLFFTGGTGWASGVELFARQRAGPVTGWIGYTLGWSRRQWDEINGGYRFPPKYDRRHDVKVVADWNRGRWDFAAAFLFATGQAFTPAAARYILTDPATGTMPNHGILLPGPKNSARLLPYHRLDVTVTRHATLFGAKADYFLQVFNVYNRRNEWFVRYDTEDPETVPKVTHQLPIVPTIGITFEI